ncbi:uncharacterized protein LOC144368656 [Ictidomys tridecemlineatus]
MSSGGRRRRGASCALGLGRGAPLWSPPGFRFPHFRFWTRRGRDSLLDSLATSSPSRCRSRFPPTSSPVNRSSAGSRRAGGQHSGGGPAGVRDGRLQQRDQAPASHVHQAGRPGHGLLLTGLLSNYQTQVVIKDRLPSPHMDYTLITLSAANTCCPP